MDRLSNSNGVHSSSVHRDPYLTAQGLERYVKLLERDFFADVTARGLYHQPTRKTDLVLNIHCNFSIEDAVYYSKTAHWGKCISPKRRNKPDNTFYKVFQELRQENINPIDIIELSFEFEETSVVVARLHDYSIVKKLSTIVLEMTRHFAYFTKGVSDIPHEIFIPVFETDAEEPFKAIEKKVNYFKYWGVYAENSKGQEETMVYNLKSKKLCNEDFYLI